MKKNYFLLKNISALENQYKQIFFLTFPCFLFKQIDLELGFDMNLMIFISSFCGSLLYLNKNKTMYT